MDAFKKLQEKEAALFEQVTDQFQRNVAKHEMTILHEDGLYRHIQFRRVDSGGYRFDLITWPWHLAIAGDIQSGHIFRRLEDMFQFFRTVDGERINPHYWAEKIVSSDEGVKRYNHEIMELLVRGELQELEHDNHGLTQAVELELFHEWSWLDLENEELVRQALYNFKFEPAGQVAYYPFAGVLSDWDFATWDHHYLWACHAITWGIKQYDKHLEEARGSGSDVPESGEEGHRRGGDRDYSL